MRCTSRLDYYHACLLQNRSSTPYNSNGPHNMVVGLLSTCVILGLFRVNLLSHFLSFFSLEMHTIDIVVELIVMITDKRHASYMHSLCRH